MRIIAFEEAPEFERPPRTQWEPLIKQLMDNETLFLPNRTSQSAVSGLQPWATRNGRRVRAQFGKRGAVEGVYVWFEPKP